MSRRRATSSSSSISGSAGAARTRAGGVESAPYFEWGGLDPDGSQSFAAKRPGWPQPIHALLVEQQVSAVFHGHDHLYVHAELDGVVYQCVPQPGNARGGTQSASEYGYSAGTILGGPGHLRVLVSPQRARIEYVRSATRGRRGFFELGAEVADRYDILAPTR